MCCCVLLEEILVYCCCVVCFFGVKNKTWDKKKQYLVREIFSFFNLFEKKTKKNERNKMCVSVCGYVPFSLMMCAYS